MQSAAASLDASCLHLQTGVCSWECARLADGPEQSEVQLVVVLRAKFWTFKQSDCFRTIKREHNHQGYHNLIQEYRHPRRPSAVQRWAWADGESMVNHCLALHQLSVPADDVTSKRCDQTAYASLSSHQAGWR